MFKLNKQYEDGIYVRDMKQGQVAKIIRWGIHDLYVGRIVQRTENTIFELGANASWGNVWTDEMFEDEYNYRVLPLVDGMKLTYKEN